jgi:Raf kinase inhibitor-like YbhB/YbcL family protein
MFLQLLCILFLTILVCPPLAWSQGPDGTKTFALICNDPDARMGKWVHWVLFNLPGNILELPENLPKLEVLKNGSRQGRNDFKGNILKLL